MLGETSFLLVLGPARPSGESSSVEENREDREEGRSEEFVAKDPGVGSKYRGAAFSGVMGGAASKSADE